MIKGLKNINYLISRKEKIKITLLLFLLIIGMFLEVVGLSAVLPLLKLVLDQNYLEGIIKEYFNDTSLYNIEKSKITVILILSFTIFYFLKSIYLIYISYYQNRLYNNLSQSISTRLFEKYINKNLLFHVENNSGLLIKNILGEISHLGAYFIGILGICSEFAIVFSIVITLIYIEPTAALSIGVFLSIISIIFFQVTKKKMLYLGYERQNLESSSNSTVLDGLSGIKELKIYNYTNHFITKLKGLNSKKSINNTLSITISQSPRFFLEFISILSLSIFLLFLFQTSSSKSDIAAVLGVFVAGAFRLLPSINKIISYSQNLKLYHSSVELIKNELFNNSNEDFSNIEKINFKKDFKISNIDYSYNDKDVLKGINLEISKNDFIGIFGKSGSGKSTLLNIIGGLLKLEKGEILIDNKVIENNLKIRSICSYVSQEPIIFEGTLLDNILMGNNFNKEKYINVLKQCQLEDFISKRNLYLKEKGMNLSGGQRQRVSLARALYKDSEILLMDEPTSSLDEATEENFMNFLIGLKGKKTLIMITHNKKLKKYFTKSFLLENRTLKTLI